MRMMMKVSIPVEAGNAAIVNGKLGSTIQRILEEIKPEAAYFVAENGQRTAFVFLNMTDSSQMTAMAEPFFLAFNAAISFQPAMNLQDLAAGAAGIEHAVKNYAE